MTMPVRRALMLIPLLGLLVALPCVAQEPLTSRPPIVVFFYQEGCPDCVRFAEVIDALEAELPTGAVARHEVGDPESRRLFERLQKAYEIDAPSMPVVFVGDRVIVGASHAKELELTDAIGRCIAGACPSPLDRLPPDTFPWRDVVELALLAAAVLLLALLQLP